MKMPTIADIRNAFEDVVPCMYSGQLHQCGDSKTDAELVHKVLAKFDIKYDLEKHYDWAAKKYPYDTYAAELLNDFADWRFLRKSDFAPLNK